MLFRRLSLFLPLLSLASFPALAEKPSHLPPLTPEQAQLIEHAMFREHTLIRTIQDHTPVVETYIQETRPDPRLEEVPVSDSYMLSRIDFDKDFFDRNYTPRQERRHTFRKASESALAAITHALRLDTDFGAKPLGFAEMMFFDPSKPEFDRYTFRFIRREFLGSVRTSVFDVQPKSQHQAAFSGRIWIEDQDANLVRLDGTFAPARRETSGHVLHFDSWRTNVRPGIWLPAAIYVEETHWKKGREKVGLKAQTRFWGFDLKAISGDSESVTLTVDDAIDRSSDSQDVSPLQASREWVTQAENNVVERLINAGLVAPLSPDGYEQKVLDQIVTNLAVPSNLAFMSPVRCRVLLTTTIEATTAGNTILLSKGLLDSLPNEEAIASVIALELAHVELGHRIDTRYAFNDRLMFPDEASFRCIDMYHSSGDNEKAAARAMQYLKASMYKDELPRAGLYWEQLADRGRVLKALITPRIGDSLLRPDGTPWMSELAASAPKIQWDNLAQIPALPLGSWLRTDAWDDTVHLLEAKRYAPMNPGEKMPLELTPVYYKLQRRNPSPADKAATSPMPTTTSQR
ncbi:MAG TPA: M48 family metalloprotease [Terracidiphilus sp.]|jgi:hypothetical protein|nr:M48 family metalloprotease [Terracidiphilus sp.]